jgi:hypothetical protein
MSCFIVSNENYQRVAKTCFLYALAENKENYPITLAEINSFIEKLAVLNCMNYSLRYKEPVDVDFEPLEKLPVLDLTAQDTRSTACWMYQTSDYMDNHEIFKLVKEAREWAEKFFSKEELDNVKWG